MIRIAALLLLLTSPAMAQAVFLPVATLASYAGASAVGFGYQQAAVLTTDTLNYESTQPWTIMAAINTRQTSAATAIIYTNVTTSPAFPGYECFLASGVLRARIIHDVSAVNWIDVTGTKNVYDGSWHFVACSYDGSGHASGVKFYVDGVPDTANIIADALSGTIVSSPQTPTIGNQTNHLDFVMTGIIDELSISQVVRSATYIRQYSVSPAFLPPVDANTVAYWHFDEDTGSTAADATGNGHTATLTTPNQWFPQ